MFKKIFSLNSKKDPFKIEKEKNYYYRIFFNNKKLVSTSTRTDAETLIAELKSIFDWNQVDNILDVEFVDKVIYDQMINILKKHSSVYRLNGNYLNEQRETGVLKYQIKSLGEVQAERELYPGIGLRKVQNGYSVDLIYSAVSFAVFSDEKKAETFIGITKSWVPWQLDNIIPTINSEKSVKSYINQLISQINNDEASINPPDADMVDRFIFLSFGEESESKRLTYLKSKQRLNEMIGLSQIKDYIDNMFAMVLADMQMNATNKSNTYSMHSLFVGPPGTGKTEFARLYADLMWSMGRIPENKLVEISKEDLVGEYIGRTEVKTQEIIESAIGGVLFVDEAYTLAGEENSNGNDFGKIALETIMRAMENHRNELIVIFAGYEKDINKLLKVNSGLESRFSHTFYFEDYTTDELKKIAELMIHKEGFDITDASDDLERVIKKKAKNGSMPGNARDIRKIVGEIITNHKVRSINESGDYRRIHPDSVRMIGATKQTRSSESMVNLKKEALEKLNQLVGLSDLKKEIQTWTNFVTIEKKRNELHLTSEPITLHMTFTGNPGTGKTTVARIVGNILKSNGLLSRGHFKEVGRTDLVAEYMGQTSAKVKSVCEEMSGGVLFIDEAYSLVQNENDSFGKEAVDTLIAEMENRREDFVVILAGYSDEIEELLDSNPGFESRISNHFEFPDYNAEELTELFMISLEQQQMSLEEGVLPIMAFYFEKSKQNNTVNGNGRWVRNVIDRLKKAQANRLASQFDINITDLQTFTIEDANEVVG